VAGFASGSESKNSISIMSNCIRQGSFYLSMVAKFCPRFGVHFILREYLTLTPPESKFPINEKGGET